MLFCTCTVSLLESRVLERETAILVAVLCSGSMQDARDEADAKDAKNRAIIEGLREQFRVVLDRLSAETEPAAVYKFRRDEPKE